MKKKQATREREKKESSQAVILYGGREHQLSSNMHTTKKKSAKDHNFSLSLSLSFSSYILNFIMHHGDTAIRETHFDFVLIGHRALRFSVRFFCFVVFM